MIGGPILLPAGWLAAHLPMRETVAAAGFYAIETIAAAGFYALIVLVALCVAWLIVQTLAPYYRRNQAGAGDQLDQASAIFTDAPEIMPMLDTFDCEV